MSESTTSYVGAIRLTLKEEMSKDDSIVVIGEDVGVYGGIFRATLGLLDEFGPHRVIDTPISEAGIVGVGMGLALGGMRPVVEIMYMDFLQLALEPLVTEVAMARFLSGGKLEVPLVVRTQYNLGRTSGPQHAQFFPSWFLQAPALSIALPSTPADVVGLLRASLRARRPVLFIESSALYNTTGPVPAGISFELGKADVKRTGKDATLIAISRVVPEAMAAAEELAREGIDVEVLDPRTLQPLDTEAIVNSVKKTGRLLIAADDQVLGGIGASITSAVLDQIFYSLQAPVKIIGPPPFPAPANYDLEREYMLNKTSIAAAVKALLAA